MGPARKKSGGGRRGARNDTSARGAAGKRPSPREPRPDAVPGSAPSRASGFPIVGVGGSAGALPALQDLFAHMPADCGLGFVVIVHTDPHAPSLLPELLARCTHLPVAEAASGQRVEPGRVYVTPPGQDIRIQNGVLALESAPESRRGVRLPIDVFFRSLAQDQGQRAVGIVLSGTGADGTLGLAAIRAESGLVLAQDKAEFDGMPGSAIAAGVVDLVLATSEMPDRLLAHAALLAPEPAPALLEGGEELHRILALVQQRTGRDFASYKAGTLRRRAERRMRLLQLEQLSDYVRVLESNPAEVEALWKDWLIGVSRFFRDPEVFRLLGEAELPRLVASKPDGSALRVWVPGCATGEEAYSLAILLVEVTEQLRKRIEVQLFASDLDPRAIELARSGCYPEGIATDMAEERLRRFFVREERCYRVKKEVRDRIVFAVQDVLRDPPFTRTDLISCRNLLIYLNSAAQQRLLPLFHYSLNPGGLLLLGTSESVTGFEELFAAADQHSKLFRRKDGTPARPPFEWAVDAPARSVPGPRQPVRAPLPSVDLADLLRRSLAERYAPPAVIIDERGEIEHVHGRTGSYLEPAPGRASLNVVEMARAGLHAPLAAAIREVVDTDATSARKTARVRHDGGFAPVEISVRRLRAPRLEKPLLLVSFEPAERASRRGPGRRKGASGRGARGQARQVEEELRTTRADLQSTIEELQASNEELASANEEVQSVNEEMQSANEELQTSKEETQSLNEELQTMNAELTAKVHDLEDARDDLVNFINSTDIAMVFLDGRLRVKRFTPEAQRIFRSDRVRRRASPRGPDQQPRLPGPAGRRRAHPRDARSLGTGGAGEQRILVRRADPAVSDLAQRHRGAGAPVHRRHARQVGRGGRSGAGSRRGHRRHRSRAPPRARRRPSRRAGEPRLLPYLPSPAGGDRGEAGVRPGQPAVEHPEAPRAPGAGASERPQLRRLRGRARLPRDRPAPDAPQRAAGRARRRAHPRPDPARLRGRPAPVE